MYGYSLSFECLFGFIDILRFNYYKSDYSGFNCVVFIALNIN